MCLSLGKNTVRLELKDVYHKKQSLEVVRAMSTGVIFALNVKSGLVFQQIGNVNIILLIVSYDRC